MHSISSITSSIHMIFTKFLFEKTYFVKTHLLMVHLSTYDDYWPSYDQITVSSVGFRWFWPFFLNNFFNTHDNPKILFWEDVFCQDACTDGSFIYLRSLLTELWPNNCFVRWSRRFWPFFLNNFVSIHDTHQILFWEDVFCQDACTDGSFIYLWWILTELWPNNCLVRWISAILTVFP
jgi:hypothetical protein